MTDIEALETQLAELTAWRTANADKVGTPQFTNSTKVLRFLTDLRDRNGGTEQERAWVAEQIKQMEG